MQDDPDWQQQAKATIDPDYVMMSAEETRQLVSDLVATADEDLDVLNRLRSKYGLPAGDPMGR
jgi:hypothetical protein